MPLLVFRVRRKYEQLGLINIWRLGLKKNLLKSFISLIKLFIMTDEQLITTANNFEGLPRLRGKHPRPW